MDSRIPGVLLDVLAAAAWRWRRMTCQTVLFPGPFLHKCRFLQFSGPALFHPVSWPIQGRDNFSTHKSTESFCRHSQVTVPEMSPRYPQMKSFSVAQLSNSMQPHGLYPSRLLYPWDFLGKNTGVGRHFLLQGIFLTQGLKPCLMHCKQVLYHLSHLGNPWDSS